MCARDPLPHNGGSSAWDPHNKDPTIWGTILGSPIFGNSHIETFGYDRFMV